MEDHDREHPLTLSASTISSTPVRNLAGEDLGKIEELMIDLATGRVAYAVLSFGGFLGLGNKLFAIPWDGLSINTDLSEDNDDRVILLNIDKEMLEFAPGFDKEHWPDTGEHAWLTDVYEYYGYDPYWR
jgi:sporulation protein YlmC with PRC-barrel domain